MRILIADDHAVVRSGFAMILEQQMDFRVVAQAIDGEEAYRLASQTQPDIILTDISMPPGENGLYLLGRIKENFSDIRIIILTMYEEQEYLVRAMRGGASGYVLKNSSDDELVKAIRTVANGEVYIASQMMAGFVEEVLGGTDLRPKLTEREQEIVTLVAYGFSNREIAQKLIVSVKTVESQKARIMGKLGLHSRPELVEYALKNKLFL
ncbi:MAG: response regulator transcription factor [Coriobacteriales bacterium]|nr:response regulator transcription factor [Coriobacteriales bacterium]